MYHLLLRGRQISLYPDLAVAFGLNEAIVIQQLHFVLQRDQLEDFEGRRWVRMSIADWQLQFPFWSESTIKRIFADLKTLGIVMSRRSRDAAAFTLDYDRMGHLGPSDPSMWPVKKGQTDPSPSIEEGKEEQEELFAGEPTAESPEDAVVSEVWTHYLNLFEGKLRIKQLTPPRRRMILKAWKAVGENTSFLIGAISGLKFYRDGHPDGSQDTSLSVIFETGPHSGRSLTDQIEWWSSQAPSGADASAVVIPTHLKHVASQNQITVARFMNRTREIPDSLEEEADAAATWLRDELGIEAKRRTDGTIQWVKTSDDDA